MFLRFYRILNYLSLDVVAGALICTCFAEKVLNITTPTTVYNSCLALSIWIIYTLDRLIDITRAGTTELSDRHRFHQTYRKVLWPAAGVALLINTWLSVNYLPYPMLVFGLLMVSVVAAYLIVLNMLPFNTSPWFQKEPLIAAVYTMGVWGSKLWIYEGEVTLRMVMLIVVPFFLLALMNLLVFSYYETDHDHLNNQRSLSSAIGAENVGRVVMILFGLVLTINLTMVRMEATTLYLMISTTRTVMAFILFGLFYRSEFFHDNERYRLLGDAVFMLPLIPMLMYF